MHEKIVQQHAAHTRMAQEISKSIAEIDKKFEKEIQAHSAIGKKNPLPEHDTLLAELDAIFDDTKLVGDRFSRKKLEKLYKRARSRYALAIPPGFADAIKPEPKVFGDFIVWSQILEFAKRRKTSILLVIDDQKDDWAVDTTGQRTLKTHPELRSEFKKRIGADFWLLTTKDFLSGARTHLESHISNDTIEEVTDASRAQRTNDFVLGKYEVHPSHLGRDGTVGDQPNVLMPNLPMVDFVSATTLQTLKDIQDQANLWNKYAILNAHARLLQSLNDERNLLIHGNALLSDLIRQNPLSLNADTEHTFNNEIATDSLDSTSEHETERDAKHDE